MGEYSYRFQILFCLAMTLVVGQFGWEFGAFALAVTLLGLRGSVKWERDDSGVYRHPNEYILYQKFGRWTKPLQYGPLALFAVASTVGRVTGNPRLIRLSWLLLAVFFAVGLYLCWVIAAEKSRRNESNGDLEKEE